MEGERQKEKVNSSARDKRWVRRVGVEGDGPPGHGCRGSGGWTQPTGVVVLAVMNPEMVAGQCQSRELREGRGSGRAVSFSQSHCLTTFSLRRHYFSLLSLLFS
ncbi:hypothetical protein Ancab_033856 [Ancistrocladus abbreviatus]